MTQIRVTKEVMPGKVDEHFYVMPATPQPTGELYDLALRTAGAEVINDK